MFLDLDFKELVFKLDEDTETRYLNGLVFEMRKRTRNLIGLELSEPRSQAERRSKLTLMAKVN